MGPIYKNEVHRRHRTETPLSGRRGTLLPVPSVVGVRLRSSITVYSVDGVEDWTTPPRAPPRFTEVSMTRVFLETRVVVYGCLRMNG